MRPKLVIGRRYVAVCGTTRVMLFVPLSRKDVGFYNKMRATINVRFEEV
jgi:hypothetical protein